MKKVLSVAEPDYNTTNRLSFTAYIFDLDGTLLDSMDIWERIDIEFLEKRGIAIPSNYISTVMPMTFAEAAAYTIRRFNLPDSIEDLTLEWNSMAAQAYTNASLKPHAKEYLTTIKNRGAKLAVAISLPARLYEPALRANNIYDIFDTLCSTDEVAHGKTHSDIFLLAAKRLGETPINCIVFEDILAAVKSAKGIGMTVCGVYDNSSAKDWPEIKKIADSVIVDFKHAPL